MSYADALPAVTATLMELLGTRLLARHIKVTAVPPDRIAITGNEPPQLNVFLYHVSHDERLSAFPRRDASGAGSVVLDLGYLLTAYGTAESDTQMLLGSAMDILHEHPVLLRDATQQVREWPEQLARIEITAASLSIDLLTSLWTAFRMPYRTSVAYRARATLTGSG